jgi:hypothetical protein
VTVARGPLATIAALSASCASTANTGGVASLDDAAVLTCTATPISGLQVYDEMATANGSGGTWRGAVQSAANAGIVWKSSPPGAACTNQLDCAPTCCGCATAGTAVAASWCNSSKRWPLLRTRAVRSQELSRTAVGTASRGHRAATGDPRRRSSPRGSCSLLPTRSLVRRRRHGSWIAPATSRA